jgi:hypothetical protein
MAGLNTSFLKVEIVSYQFDGSQTDYPIEIASNDSQYPRGRSYSRVTRHHDKQPEDRIGIQATFAQGYKTRFDLRMKATLHGRACGEKLIENNQIHNAEGHTIFDFALNDMEGSSQDSSASGSGSGQSSPT